MFIVRKGCNKSATPPMLHFEYSFYYYCCNEFVAFRAILQRISVDFYDKTTSEPCRAPLLTDVQRTMLGFMVKLEALAANGILDKFLFLAEQKLLTCDSVQVMIPITRLFLAICRMQKNLFRLRKLCCDIFYFCGDLALPFFFTVLTSWTEVLPQAINCDSKY